MATLGEMLVRDKVISKGQLEEAIQNQVIFGGRLGTNLIEMRLLDEPTLTKYLARKHGVPTVDWTLLNRIKPSVLKLFNKKLANSAEGFPLKVDGKDIYVVMTDPANLNAIQEINFATGMNVKPLVLPEVRVYDLLTRFYGIGREMRYIGLAMMYQKPVEKKKPLKQAYKSTAPGLSDKEAKEREHLKQQIASGRSGDLLGEDEFQQMTDDQFRGQQQKEEPVDVGMPSMPESAPPPPEPEAPAEPAPPPAAPTAPKPGPPEKTAPAVAVPRRTTPAGQPPYKETAQALYSLLMKGGAEKYISRKDLQEFLKLFVKSQLKDNILSMNYLANWFIIEANAPVEWLEDILEEFKKAAPELGIAVVLPGEQPPKAPPKKVEAIPAEEAPAEVIEEAEPIPEEEITPVEPAPPAPPEAPAEPAPPEKPAEEVISDIEQMAEEETAGPAMPEMMELSAEDLATAAEAEEFVPDEVEEEIEEEEEEEYVQLSLDEARQKLHSEVEDRRDISRIVLGFAKGYFKRSVLFTVRGETLYGWDGVGPDISTGLAESIMLPLNEPNVFQLVNTTMSFFLGPMQPNPVNDRFLKHLGNERPNNVFIMPVVVNEKVVYMLYGDNGDGEFVPPTAPELQILAYQVPQALEDLIKRKKAQMPST